MSDLFDARWCCIINGHYDSSTASFTPLLYWLIFKAPTSNRQSFGIASVCNPILGVMIPLPIQPFKIVAITIPIPSFVIPTSTLTILPLEFWKVNFTIKWWNWTLIYLSLKLQYQYCFQGYFHFPGYKHLHAIPALYCSFVILSYSGKAQKILRSMQPIFCSSENIYSRVHAKIIWIGLCAVKIGVPLNISQIREKF